MPLSPANLGVNKPAISLYSLRNFEKIKQDGIHITFDLANLGLALMNMRCKGCAIIHGPHYFA